MNYYFKGTHKEDGSVIYFNMFSKQNKSFILASVKEDYFKYNVEVITKEEYWKNKYMDK